MAKEEERKKVLTYRRAEFLAEQPGGGTLQKYLAQAHSMFPTVDQRRVVIPGRPDLEGRNFHAKDSMFLLHIAAYTPGEEASVIPKLRRGAAKGDVSTAPPPEECEFMDGDITALISDNHVILCASNLHEKNAESYMAKIIDRAKINETAARFELSKVVKADKVALIQKQGVKAVSLDANLYNATLDYTERKTVAKKIGGDLGIILSAFFGKDPSELDLEFAQNLSVKVLLSFDSRRKGSHLVGQRLQSVATELVDDQEEGFAIVTKGGELIRQNDVVLKKTTMLPRHGKTVYCSSAWDAMETYFIELKEGGHLEL